MVKRTMRKIHDFRIFFLGSFVTIFLFNVGISPIDLSRYFAARLSSAVGMNVSVPVNSINYLAVQLEDKQKRLDRREQELNERMAQSPAEIRNNPVLSVMAAGIVILFILVLLNYYFDYRRRLEEQMFWQLKKR